MARRTIAPALADIRQDIAGEIPVDLILRWSTQRKSSQIHDRLLEPYEVAGTVVCSDSAGLSRLTASKQLFEVLQMVSKPKEILYAYGKKIGGNPVGVWAADNTQMYYSNTIDPIDVVYQMIAAQKEIDALLVHIGLGIHRGKFWHIGGGLYGDEADFVEGLAESHTDGGEIVLTETVRTVVESKITTDLLTRTDPELPIAVYSVDYRKLHPVGQKETDDLYPVPFDKPFFEALRTFKPQNQSDEVSVLTRYQSDKIVILVKVIHTQKRYLLDELTDWVIANAVVKRFVTGGQITEVKSNGSLGIFVTSDALSAVEFARSIQNAMRDNGYIVSVGIAKGDVLLFPQVHEIAGGPVNIASKLAEDVGKPGMIYIHESVSLKHVRKSESFVKKISGVEIKGCVVA